MKKLKAAARPIGRTVRSPVIAVRVPAPLHRRITESAKVSGRSMSEEMAALLTRGFEWQEAFGDRVKMLEQARGEIDRMVRGNLEAEMRRKGWRPLHGSPYWIDPEHAPKSEGVDSEPAPKSEWIDPEAPLPEGWTDMGTDYDQFVETVARAIKARAGQQQQKKED